MAVDKLLYGWSSLLVDVFHGKHHPAMSVMLAQSTIPACVNQLGPCWIPQIITQYTSTTHKEEQGMDFVHRIMYKKLQQDYFWVPAQTNDPTQLSLGSSHF